jgi:hypothetical protein
MTDHLGLPSLSTSLALNYYLNLFFSKMTYSLRSNAMKKDASTNSSTMDAGSLAWSALCPPPTNEAKSYQDVAKARSLPWPPTGNKEPSGTPVTEQEKTETYPCIAEGTSNELSSVSLSGLSNEDDDNPNPWITIQPWHSRSLESLSKLQMNKNVNWA